MKKKFSVEQIVSVLKRAEVGVPIAELIRKVGITEQTYYRWKAKYAGLEVDQVRQIKQLRDENTRLKQLVAELTLDKTMLQDVLRKSCKALAAASVGEASGTELSCERTARLLCSGTGASDASLRGQAGAVDRVADAAATVTNSARFINRDVKFH
jgi:putative transposase